MFPCKSSLDLISTGEHTGECPLMATLSTRTLNPFSGSQKSNIRFLMRKKTIHHFSKVQQFVTVPKTIWDQSEWCSFKDIVMQ